jgi:hypothetical protein
MLSMAEVQLAILPVVPTGEGCRGHREGQGSDGNEVAVGGPGANVQSALAAECGAAGSLGRQLSGNRRRLFAGFYTTKTSPGFLLNISDLIKGCCMLMCRGKNLRKQTRFACPTQTMPLCKIEAGNKM